MRRTLATVLTAVFLLALVPAVTGCKPIPKKWYEPTLQYYSDGIKNGFEQEFRNLPVPDDLKDKSKKQGYLLIDLDKDGAKTKDELDVRLLNRISQWLAYGGDKTLPQLQKLGPKALQNRLDYARNLPLYYRMGDFYFCHAGVKPGVPLD